MQEFFGIPDPVDQIRRKNEIKRAQGEQVKGIPGTKTDVFADGWGDQAGPGWLRSSAFCFQPKADGTPLGKGLGRANEGF